MSEDDMDWMAVDEELQEVHQELQGQLAKDTGQAGVYLKILNRYAKAFGKKVQSLERRIHALEAQQGQKG